jgi:hypothetical protein
MPSFHYIVRAKLIRRLKAEGEIEFLEVEDKFENTNPIVARNSAFKHYQNYLEVFLEAKGKQYNSDKQAREDIDSLISKSTVTKLIMGGRELNLIDSFDNGIGIFLVIDELNPEVQATSEKVGDEIFIHGIGEISASNNNPDYQMSNLETELDLYKANSLDTDNQEVFVLFCCRGEWEEGYLGEGKWLESYHEPDIREILKTPFDWADYEQPYWWGDPNDDESRIIEEIPPTIEELIRGGESNQVEFKPTLLYNFSTQRAGIGIKQIIAKTIASFINSNGGFLFIGLNDHGEPQGLSNDFSLGDGKGEKDFFLLEFDQMLQYFLTFSVKNNVNGEFKLYEGVEVFVVDSLMKMSDISEESLEKQKLFADRLAVTARDLQVQIFLVAHTRKMKDETEIPDATNIMGSSHIRNLCDNIICVWRNRYKEKLVEEGKTSDDELKIIPDAKVFVQKNRNGQWEGSFNFWFSQKTLCYREAP